MQPPDPFWPATGSPGPTRAAAALAGKPARHGHTGICTATTEKFAVISVTAGLTVRTNGRMFWCTHGGQRHTWPAEPAAALAASWPAIVPP
jgi:hypothetical protein